MMNFKNITIAGGGVLGSQIAFQTAFHGFNVSLYDINEEAVEKTKQAFERLKEAYKTDLNATHKQVDDTYNSIQIFTDLKASVADADLVIEAIPEVVEIKKKFYTTLGQVAPDKTVFATNTSTLLPSMFAEETGRPEKFLALHFANEIWKHNTAEIMGQPKTDELVFNQLIDFGQSHRHDTFAFV